MAYVSPAVEYAIREELNLCSPERIPRSYEHIRRPRLRIFNYFSEPDSVRLCCTVDAAIQRKRDSTSRENIHRCWIEHCL